MLQYVKYGILYAHAFSHNTVSETIDYCGRFYHINCGSPSKETLNRPVAVISTANIRVTPCRSRSMNRSGTVVGTVTIIVWRSA